MIRTNSRQARQNVQAYIMKHFDGCNYEIETPATFQETAAVFVEAIKTISTKPANLDNLESYLSHHFPEWLSKYANTPENIAAEMRDFAKMEF